MVDEVFGVHPEFPIEDLLVERGDSHQVVDAVRFEPVRYARPYAPDVGEGAMRPDVLAESFGIERADSVLLVFGADIEGHLRQKQVGADAHGCRDAGS